jgi:hypothetical protein
MQLNLDIKTPVQTKKSWAFALDLGQGGLRKRSKLLSKNLRPNLRRCVITACSREAKELGVRPGMRYMDAKARIPSLKILVCNW